MVKIEEVQDESEKLRQQGQNAEFDDDQDWEEDSESDEDLSDDEVTERGVAVPNETLWERISALKDIVSPATRASLSKTFRTYSAYGFFGGWVCAKLIWVGVTSAIMVGLPFALAVEDESRISAQEKEMYGAQGAPQGVPSGAPAAGEPHAAVQPGETQGLRPPGF